MKNIVVATPSYKNTVTVPYMQSMIEYHTSDKFRIAYNIYPGDSLVARARNTIFTNIIDNMSYFDYILWQDDDVAATKYGIERLLDFKLDVVAMATPIKVPTSSYGIVCAVANVYEEISPLLYKSTYAGFGSFMISKKACLDIVEYCEDNNYWYVDYGQKFYDICKTGANSGNFYESEDYYFCSMLKNIGYDIHVDSGSGVLHDKVYRAGSPINPQSIGKKYNKTLNNEDILNFWTPNDYNTQGITF
jgi:hypothetical protein